jgi:hypothetical protein
MRESEQLKEYAEKWIAAEDRMEISGIGNVEQHVYSLRREVAKLQAEVDEFIAISGCANKGRAKSHFRTLIRSKKTQHDLTLVRETFHKITSTWLDGVAKKGSILAEAPISHSKALVEHEALMPYIIRAHQACSKLEDGDEILDQFERDYLRMGKKQFGNLLYKFVEDIMEQEDELEEEQTTKLEAASLSELAKIVNRKIDYGVVSREQFIEEQN